MAARKRLADEVKNDDGQWHAATTTSLNPDGTIDAEIETPNSDEDLPPSIDEVCNVSHKSVRALGRCGLDRG